jgi:hypothetical protein
MPTKAKKSKPKEKSKIKISKEAEEEIVCSTTRRRATFSYTLSYLDVPFGGLDILVYYDEIDDFEQIDDDRQKVVDHFEVDGSSIVSDLKLLESAVEDLVNSFKHKDIKVTAKERENMIYRIMHNVKNFIYSNEMSLG